jgi:type IV pilus assembly protein PilM
MLSFGQSKAVIGLDVGSYGVKAVALQANKDRITLQGFASARIDKQDVGEVVKGVFAQLGVKSRRVCTAVSGRSVIVRQVETPRLEGPALQQHISHEADKYIPFGSEEVIIDAQPLPDPDGKKPDNLSVMLVAVRRSFVSEHIAQLKLGGVEPEIVDVDVFALANCYEVLGPPAPPEAEKKATALIDIGAAKSNIAILQGNRLLFTREVYLAGNEITEAVGRALAAEPDDVDRLKLAPGEMLDQLLDAAQPAFEDLANEIRLSFDYVEGQFDCEVSTVVLSGGSAQLPNAASILGNLLGRPVHVFDPLAGLDLVPSRYDIHGLDANSPSLAVALGLALHLLEFPQKGLGGSQSHAWQPRQGRGAGIDAAPAANEPAPAPEPSAPEPVSPAPAPTYTPSGGAPVVSPGPMPTPLFVTPAGGVPAAPQPATIDIRAPQPATIDIRAPQPATIDMPAPVAAAIAPPDADRPRSAASEMYLGESGASRSGLLVVLDDDQEMPPPLASERIAKGDPGATGTGSTSRSAIKIEGFAEETKDDNAGGGDLKLPDLPPLPPKQ